MLLLILLIILPIVIKKYIDYLNYTNSNYSKQTNNKFSDVYKDEGKMGEYQISKLLDKIEGNSKALYNIYIPKKNNTTEIDVILIHETGLYVIESKNYSGWIYGKEKQYQWTQILWRSNWYGKNRFYNPIMQNKNHIKWLKLFLNNDLIPIYSYIVFSERCELKKIEINSKDIKVVKRYNLLNCLEFDFKKNKSIYNKIHIEIIYNLLYPYTQLSEEQKQEHIASLK